MTVKFTKTLWLHHCRPFAVALVGLMALSPWARADIRPPRGLIEMSFFAAYWPWIVALVVTAAIISLIIFLIRRRKPKAKVEIPISPYELARKDLMEARRLMEQRKDKAFSICISNTVRYYIERTYQVAAPEQTTEEFLMAASTHPQLSAEPLARLSEFLQLCDIAKFAQQTFGDKERQAQYDSAREFIEESHKKHSLPNPSTTAAQAPLQAQAQPAAQNS